MKFLFGSTGFLHHSNCLELDLTNPCFVCKCRIGREPGHYDTCCCWINQHYYELTAKKQCGVSLEEIRDRFELLLTKDGINATIPERLLYLRIVVEKHFPEFLQILNELVDRHKIERIFYLE